MALAIAGGPARADDARLDDPNVDRGFLLPTAETQPARTFTISDYEIVLAGVTYGITDRLQIGVTGLVLGPVFDVERMVLGNVKWQAMRWGPLHVALDAAFTYSVANRDDLPGHLPPATTYSPQAGIVASLCLTEGCHSLVTANVHGLVGLGDGEARGTVLYSLAATMRLWSHGKLLLELSRQAAIAREKDRASPMLGVGLRLFGSHVAGDLGLLAAIDSGGGLVPFPFASLTVRF